jgi:outer membrane protein
MPRNAPHRRSDFVHTRPAVCVGLVTGFLAGCSSPFAVQSERDLRRSVTDSVRREIAESQLVPSIRSPERQGGVERLKLKPELIPILESIAGPASYDKNVFPMDEDLLGRPQTFVPVTLERAIRTAAVNNIQVQFARLAPAIAEAQVVAAQAAFDITLFSNSEWNMTDQERALFRQNFSTSGLPFDKRNVGTNATGLRRPLTTGGQLTFQQDLTYTDVSTPGGNNIPDPTNELAWVLRLEQPLLRGFGSDVTLAQVRLNRNAERDQICQLKSNLIRTITDTERTYWQLVQAHRNLLIVQRLYERGERVQRQVEARENLDATPAQIADARATVFRRQGDVTAAQNAFRSASDTLKVLMNDPDQTIGGEALLVPVDDALDAPISFSLLDVMLASVRNRPEAQQAIISIDNTSIRMQVADNARLPRLDLRLQTRLSALGDDFRDNYEEAVEGRFIDYLIGIQFEQPIGNRAAEAAYRQRRLERMQATEAYRNTIQQVLLEAKRALRAVVTGYRLIEQRRTGRVAQSESLRSFEADIQIIRGHDVQTLDLQFRRQEALAQSEQDEIQALIDYNTALAQLYAAMGTALEHNKINFRIPDADADLAKGGLDNPPNGKVVPKNTDGVAPIGPKTPWIFGGERERGKR